jgi:hypothetical protein
MNPRWRRLTRRIAYAVGAQCSQCRQGAKRFRDGATQHVVIQNSARRSARVARQTELQEAAHSLLSQPVNTAVTHALSCWGAHSRNYPVRVAADIEESAKRCRNPCRSGLPTKCLGPEPRSGLVQRAERGALSGVVACAARERRSCNARTQRQCNTQRGRETSGVHPLGFRAALPTSLTGAALAWRAVRNTPCVSTGRVTKQPGTAAGCSTVGRAG